MQRDSYKIGLKVGVEYLDEGEQRQLLEDINNEVGIKFTEDNTREELHDPATAVAFYSAGIATISLYIRLREWFSDQNEPVEIDIWQEDGGDIYIIDAKEANQVGATVLEQENNVVAAEMSYEEIKELQKLREREEDE